MKVHKNIDDGLTAFVHKVVEDAHQVVLYNQTSRGEFCVNSKLISRGVATKTDPMSDIFFKLNVRKPSPYQKPLMINSRNVSYICLRKRIVYVLYYKFNVITERSSIFDR